MVIMATNDGDVDRAVSRLMHVDCTVKRVRSIARSRSLARSRHSLVARSRTVRNHRVDARAHTLLSFFGNTVVCIRFALPVYWSLCVHTRVRAAAAASVETEQPSSTRTTVAPPCRRR